MNSAFKIFNQMKSILLTIGILLCISNALYSQDTVFLRYRNSSGNNYTEDTFVKNIPFGPNFLFETCWLNKKQNFQFGLIPDSLIVSCDARNYYDGEQTKERGIEYSDTLLKAKIDIVANCCHSFICDFQVVKDSILNFSYSGYGSNCGCMCKHQLEFRMQVDNSDERKAQEFEKVRYISFNNEFIRKFR